MATLKISSLNLFGYDVSINTWDQDFPIPVGYIPDGAISGVAPGDTVTINLSLGHLVSSTITQDPEDAPIDWNQVYVGMGNETQNYDGFVDGGGNYSIYSGLGTFSLGVYAPGYLADPAYREVVVTGDTTGGLDFIINETHCMVSGTLLNVPLPLNASYYGVMAQTGTDGTDGYIAYGEVDSLNGTYTLFLSDGEWTITPPCCFGEFQPDPVVLTIGESPDNSRQQDFDYASPGCCVGQTGNADGSLDGVFDIADVIFLVDYMFNDGPAPSCYEESEVSGDGSFDIADIVYLVDYMFNDGVPPVMCP